LFDHVDRFDSVWVVEAEGVRTCSRRILRPRFVRTLRPRAFSADSGENSELPAASARCLIAGMEVREYCRYGMAATAFLFSCARSSANAAPGTMPSLHAARVRVVKVRRAASLDAILSFRDSIFSVAHRTADHRGSRREACQTICKILAGSYGPGGGCGWFPRSSAP